MGMETYLLRVETLEPIRALELFEGDELVYVVNGEVEIQSLEEAAARLREPSGTRH
jgi:hypothetical protein